VSDAGRRVAVLDVPHTRPVEGLNGVQVSEWGAHDRHFGTRSWPATTDPMESSSPPGRASAPATAVPGWTSRTSARPWRPRWGLVSRPPTGGPSPTSFRSRCTR
jgi:hypothetical protein